MADDIKLALVTVASDLEHYGLRRLRWYCEKWGWDLRVVGDPKQYRGFTSKLVGVRDALPGLIEEGVTHVVFTDAYDTVVVGPPIEVSDLIWRDMTVRRDGMLLSAEIACWPDDSKRHLYPSHDSRWKYVNSGGYVAEIGLLSWLLEGCESCTDDQRWFTDAYLSSLKKDSMWYGMIERDCRCRIFQTLGHVYPHASQHWTDTFAVVEGRPLNTDQHTSPLFWHFNGRMQDAQVDWIPGVKEFRTMDDQKYLEEHIGCGLQLGERLTPEQEASRKSREEMVAVIDQLFKPVPPLPPLGPEYTYDYRKIRGFGEHDFANFYEKLVDKAPRGATIVEVGCFHGRSLVQLGLYAKAQDKGLRIVGVEHGVGQGDGCVPIITRHLIEAGLQESVELLQLSSVEGATMFDDSSVWCVFLDDGHLHEEVEASIRAWMPKVDHDGILAGHDAKWHTVAQPVRALLSGVGHDLTWPDCWFCRKQDVRLANSEDIHKHFNPPSWYAQSSATRNDGKKSGTLFPLPDLSYDPPR